MCTHARIFMVFKVMFLILKYHACTQYIKVTFIPSTAHLASPPPHTHTIFFPFVQIPFFFLSGPLSFLCVHLLPFFLSLWKINGSNNRFGVFIIETSMDYPGDIAALYFFPSFSFHYSSTQSSMTFPGTQRGNTDVQFGGKHSAVIYS